MMISKIWNITLRLEQNQREAFEKAIKEYESACLKSFKLIKEGDTIQTCDFPKPEEFMIIENTIKSQMIEQAGYCATTGQSGVLMSSVQNKVKGTPISQVHQKDFQEPDYQ